MAHKQAANLLQPLHNTPELSGHARHAVAPSVAEYVRAPQFVHSTEPLMEYLPAAQARHAVAPCIAEYVPDAQFVHSIEPLTEYLPAAQARHAVAPCVAEYVPAPHCVHVSALSPNDPALQVQSVMDTLEPCELELVGQDIHDALPVILLYLPVPHSIQFGPVRPAIHEQVTPS